MYSYTNEVIRELLASSDNLVNAVNKDITRVLYGKPQQFNTESELYQSITGHKSKHIK